MSFQYNAFPKEKKGSIGLYVEFGADCPLTMAKSRDMFAKQALKGIRAEVFEVSQRAVRLVQAP